MVVLNLVDKLLVKRTKLCLERCTAVQVKVSFNNDAVILIPPPEHIRMTPDVWREQVVDPLATGAIRDDMIRVCMLRLGPKGLADRKFEFLHDRGKNGKIPQVYEPLARRAEERKALVAAMKPSPRIPIWMHGSVVDAKDDKYKARVGVMTREEQKHWKVAFG